MTSCWPIAANAVASSIRELRRGRGSVVENLWRFRHGGTKAEERAGGRGLERGRDRCYWPKQGGVQSMPDCTCRGMGVKVAWNMKANEKNCVSFSGCFFSLVLLPLAVWCGSSAAASAGQAEADSVHPVYRLNSSHWHALGLFEWTKENRRFWGDRPLPPDNRFDTSATYEGLAGKVAWIEVPEWDQDNKVHEIREKLKPRETRHSAAAYLYRRIDSPAETDAILYLGFDDGLVLNLNGEIIFERFFYRNTEPRQEAIPIRLKQGRNDLLLKIIDKDNTGGSAFCFDIRPSLPPDEHVRLLEDLITRQSNEPVRALDTRCRLMHLYRQTGQLAKADATAQEVLSIQASVAELKEAAQRFLETRPGGIGRITGYTVEAQRATFHTERGKLHVGYWRDTAPRVTFVPTDTAWPYPPSHRPLPVGWETPNKSGINAVTDAEDRFVVKGIAVPVEVFKDGSGIAFLHEGRRRFVELGMRPSLKRVVWSQAKTFKGPFEEIVFHLDTREGVFGMGNRYDALNRRGRLNIIGNCDRAFGESHFTLPHFLTQGRDALFINSFGDGEIGVDRPEAENMAVCQLQEDVIDLFYFAGPPRALVRQYADLTGHTVMPPDWTLGVWMSRNSYENEAVVLDVARKLREHKVPAHVLVLEAWREDGKDWMSWNTERWPRHQAMCKTLHEMGFKIVLWTMQFHIYNLARPQPYEQEAFDNRYFVMDGERPWGYEQGQEKNSYIVDFFNPAACAWWERQYRRLFDPVIGIDGLKTDIGENNGGTTWQGWKNINNIYALGYLRCAWDMTKDITGEGMVFARTGTVGTQRYPILWAGDHSAWFQGMQEAFNAMMNAGLSGYAWTSFDIGGLYGDLDKETYVRMAQMGAFCPIMQVHGQGRREPYDFGDYGEQATEVFNRYATWYMRLKPYRIAAGREACETGVPIIRPLWMDHPDDPECYEAEYEYLFGPDVLVAPIVSYNHTRKVYLPRGQWIDWWTGERIVGGRYLRVTMPLEQVPLYVKPGSLVLRLSPGSGGGNEKSE